MLDLPASTDPLDRDARHALRALAQIERMHAIGERALHAEMDGFAKTRYEKGKSEDEEDFSALMDIGGFWDDANEAAPSRGETLSPRSPSYD